MNKAQARSFFPYLKNEIIYFNHAATGPFSSLAVDRLNDLLKEKSEKKIDDFESFVKVMIETKSLLAEMINCKDDRIAFVDNTTNGLIMLANSINWKKGGSLGLKSMSF